MRLGVKTLKLTELFVDSDVQRSISKASLNKKIKEFDANAVGVLIVSKRKNGKYHILDGQHRFLAALENGVEELDCEIHINLTEREEAELFLKYNQERISTKPIDHFNIEVKAGEESSVIINEILKQYELNVSRRGIQSPKALKQVYKYYGENILRRTIYLINEVWGLEGLKAQSITGIASFVELGGASLELEKFISNLKKRNDTKIFEKIRTQAERYKYTQRYTLSEAFCQVMIFQYNKMFKNSEKWVVRDPLAGLLDGR